MSIVSELDNLAGVIKLIAINESVPKEVRDEAGVCLSRISHIKGEAITVYEKLEQTDKALHEIDNKLKRCIGD